MKDKVALFIDDDSVMVSSIMDQLRAFFSEREMDLAICTASENLSGILGAVAARRADVPIAIVDLWMIDKRTNSQNKTAGYEIINEIRKKWPHCYLVVFSGHIDEEVQSNLKRYTNLAALEKPLPTFVLEDKLDDLLNQMGICRTSGSVPA